MDYRAAGVDLAAADRHTGRIAGPVTATWGADVIGDFGGFAAGIRVPAGYRDPVLMLSTDGVGTKIELARRTGRWEGIGFDLVAMCADDLAAAGARPLALVDYLAVGRLDPERDAAIVASVARACGLAGCALLGGETAEHPGVMSPEAVDLAGTALGVVEAGAELGPEKVAEADVVVGLASPNLRANGFSLVRAVFDGVDLDHPGPGGAASLGEVLVAPAVIYAPAVMEAVAAGGVHAAAHVTGGGLEANLARALPPHLGAEIDHGAWSWPAVFAEVQARGSIPTAEMRRAFNLGIGFCLVVNPAQLGGVLAAVAAHDPVVIGRVG